MQPDNRCDKHLSPAENDDGEIKKSWVKEMRAEALWLQHLFCQELFLGACTGGRRYRRRQM